MPLADQSVFVRASIQGVLREALIAAALTGIMILLFLGSWRSTLIVCISIPLSILTSLSILILEVYYRYPPLYHDRDGKIAGSEDAQFAADTAEAEAAGAEADEPPGAAFEVAWMSATISFGQSGTVLIASQILFASSCVFVVPLKYSLPSRSSACPSIPKPFAT